MVVAVQYRRPSLNKNVMVQIYGIDLGMSSFDVSFLSESGSVRHLSGVKNTVHGISKFLLSLPSSAVLCAEHTGVYGDLLLRLCTLNRTCLCFVPGYQIKHSLGLQRGKSDPLDACRIREYAERFYAFSDLVSILGKRCLNFRNCIVHALCWWTLVSAWTL